MATIKIDYKSLKSDASAAGGTLSNPPAEPRKPVSGIVVIQLPKMDPITLPGVTDEAYDINFKATKRDVSQLLSIDLASGKNNYKNKGGQVLINSDRVVINSRTDYLMLFGGAGVAIASQGSVNIDSQQTVTLFGEQGLFLGLPNKGEPYDPNTPPAPAERGDPTPNNEYEPIVLGIKLANILEDLIYALQQSITVTALGLGYFREDTQYELLSIKARIPEILSTYAYIEGISHEPAEKKPAKPTRLSEPAKVLVGKFQETKEEIPGVKTAGASGVLSGPDASLPGVGESSDPFGDGDLD